MSELFMVAGESSADMHGAALLLELKKKNPYLHCWGVGGPRLAEAGMNVILPAGDINVVGGTDWLEKMEEVVTSYREIKNAVCRRPPPVAVLIDLPDFNLRLAKVLKALGTRVIYYISPQVWAWRKYRIRSIRKNVDEMLVVFPFEKEFYDRQGVSSTFVGHPLLERISPRLHFRNPDELLKSPRIALLPGSRKSEIRLHAEVVCETIKKLRLAFPSAQFCIPVANTLDKEWVKSCFDVPSIQFQNSSIEVLHWADVALVASGTATLETALVGTPFCLFYRVTPSSAFLFRTFARYRGFIGMPNVLKQREIVKEFFQERATAESLVEECTRLLRETVYRNRVATDLHSCRAILGGSPASQRAAARVQLEGN